MTGDRDNHFYKRQNKKSPQGLIPRDLCLNGEVSYLERYCSKEEERQNSLFFFDGTSSIICNTLGKGVTVLIPSGRQEGKGNPFPYGL